MDFQNLRRQELIKRIVKEDHEVRRDVVFYIDKNKATNPQISANFQEYCSRLKEEGYKFIYMPQIIQQLSSPTKLFLTGSCNYTATSDSNSLKRFFKPEFWEQIPEAAFVFCYKEKWDYTFIPYSEEITPSQLALHFKNHRIKREQEQKNQPQVRYSIGAGGGNSKIDKKEEYFENDFKRFKFESNLRFSELTDDYHFKKYLEDLSQEQMALAMKTKECITELRDLGFPLDFIQQLVRPNIKLNELVITKDYRFTIPSVGKEIELVPLEKALYIFYLNHPEGVNFKDLVDYVDEIFELYKKISTRWNIFKLKSTIKNMVDPTRNDINVRTSRIRKAFQILFSEEIARYYYISGGKGENKKILLDRKFVKFE